MVRQPWFHRCAKEGTSGLGNPLHRFLLLSTTRGSMAWEFQIVLAESHELPAGTHLEGWATACGRFRIGRPTPELVHPAPVHRVFGKAFELHGDPCLLHQEEHLIDHVQFGAAAVVGVDFQFIVGGRRHQLWVEIVGECPQVMIEAQRLLKLIIRLRDLIEIGLELRRGGEPAIVKVLKDRFIGLLKGSVRIGLDLVEHLKGHVKSERAVTLELGFVEELIGCSLVRKGWVMARYCWRSGGSSPVNDDLR